MDFRRFLEASDPTLDKLVSLGNYTRELARDVYTMKGEVPYLSLTGTPRYKYVDNLVKSVFGQFANRLHTLRSLPKGSLEYYFSADTSKGLVERLFKEIEEEFKQVKKMIYKDEYPEYERASRILAETSRKAALLSSIFKDDLLRPQGKEDVITVQEFPQHRMEGEPKYKSVYAQDKPTIGSGWKIKKPEGWVWWKTNWDTSD